MSFLVALILTLLAANPVQQVTTAQDIDVFPITVRSPPFGFYSTSYALRLQLVVTDPQGQPITEFYPVIAEDLDNTVSIRFVTTLPAGSTIQLNEPPQ